VKHSTGEYGVGSILCGAVGEIFVKPRSLEYSACMSARLDRGWLLHDNGEAFHPTKLLRDTCLHWRVRGGLASTEDTAAAGTSDGEGS